MILQYLQVKATLSVIEDERNRFLAKLLEEENLRQNLEGKYITPQVHLMLLSRLITSTSHFCSDSPEQIQKLEHDRSELENDKRQLENQHKTLEQKLEIMSEMYQQKENALHQ